MKSINVTAWDKSGAEPLVSIIMPCYNSADFIDEAVCSVIDQTYKSWELLVCDDGSTDESKQIAEGWARKDHRINVLQNRFKKGAPGARNTCLSAAQGRYIAFLDSDDVWLPNKLEVQLRFMEHTKAAFVFGYCENMSEHGMLLSTTKSPSAISFRKLLLSNFIPCLTVIYDTKKIGKVPQPSIEKRNDFALWLLILKQNKNLIARCYPDVLARYRVNHYGLSAGKLSAIRYFYWCLRKYAGLGTFTASCLSTVAVTFKVLKTLSPNLYNVIVTKIL